MTTITLLQFRTTKTLEEIEKELNRVSNNFYWIVASKETENRLKIIFNYKVQLSEALRRVLETGEIKRIFNGISSEEFLTRRIIAYIHFDKEILEIDRGIDKMTLIFINILEKVLKIKFYTFYIPSKVLIEIIRRHTISLNQIYFKFIDGLIFEMYKGKFLQNSELIKKKIDENSRSVRIITIIPRIKFENYHKSFTINGDKGTIKFFGSEIFRTEVQQLIDLIFEVNKRYKMGN